MAKENLLLTGPNVTLRPITGSDAETIASALNDPEARRLTGTHAEFSLKDVQAHCARIKGANDRWDYGITVSGRLIGDTALTEVDHKNASASFRIAIWHCDMRNKGIGTETTQLMIKFGFEHLKLHRIELEVFAFNPRALKVYEKVGFTLEGTKRDALNWQGAWIDAHMMAMLSSEYEAHKMPVTAARLRIKTGTY